MYMRILGSLCMNTHGWASGVHKRISLFICFGIPSIRYSNCYELAFVQPRAHDCVLCPLKLYRVVCTPHARATAREQHMRMLAH